MTKSHKDTLLIRPRTGPDGFEIRAVVENGVCPYINFWKSECKKRPEEDFFLAEAFKYLSSLGKTPNPRSFRFEEDGIFAITGRQVRVYCFFDSERLILLTNGAIKKSQKANPQDLKRAKRLRKAYESHVRK